MIGALRATLTSRLVLWRTPTLSLHWWLHRGWDGDNWWGLFHLDLTQQLVFLIHLVLFGLCMWRRQGGDSPSDITHVTHCGRQECGRAFANAKRTRPKQPLHFRRDGCIVVCIVQPRAAVFLLSQYCCSCAFWILIHRFDMQDRSQTSLILQLILGKKKKKERKTHEITSIIIVIIFPGLHLPLPAAATPLGCGSTVLFINHVVTNTVLSVAQHGVLWSHTHQLDKQYPTRARGQSERASELQLTLRVKVLLHLLQTNAVGTKLGSW